MISLPLSCLWVRLALQQLDREGTELGLQGSPPLRSGCWNSGLRQRPAS